jgi:hypothetical protein
VTSKDLAGFRQTARHQCGQLGRHHVAHLDVIILGAGGAGD